MLSGGIAPAPVVSELTQLCLSTPPRSMTRLLACTSMSRLARYETENRTRYEGLSAVPLSSSWAFCSTPTWNAVKHEVGTIRHRPSML